MSIEIVDIMFLSKKCTYGIRALLELLSVFPNGKMTIRDIAERTGISKKFLDQLLLLMKREGILESKKGSNGGYFLAKPPEQITMYSIITALNGPLYISDCMAPFHNCIKKNICRVQQFSQEIQELIEGYSRKTTLKQMAEKKTEKEAISYCI